MVLEITVAAWNYGMENLAVTANVNSCSPDSPSSKHMDSLWEVSPSCSPSYDLISLSSPTLFILRNFQAYSVELWNNVTVVLIKKHVVDEADSAKLEGGGMHKGGAKLDEDAIEGANTAEIITWAHRSCYPYGNGSNFHFHHSWRLTEWHVRWRARSLQNVWCPQNSYLESGKRW